MNTAGMLFLLLVLIGSAIAFGYDLGRYRVLRQLERDRELHDLFTVAGRVAAHRARQGRL
jgi:hypothetical protein